MYSSEKFVTDSVNGTKKVFNNSSLGSASVELVQVSQHSSKVFANFSSILILELSQMATEIHRISCGDAVNNNDTSVNISIVTKTLPDVCNFSVRINTSSILSIVILAVTWKQYAECSQYQEEILYNLSLLYENTSYSKSVSSSVCTPTCFVPFEVLVTGNNRIYVATLQARNSIGTSNITTYSGVIPAGAIVCDTPSTPINESLGILSAESGLTEGSKIVLQCDDSLLPSHPRTATCVQVLGRGEWVPNLADLHCEGVLHKIASESL
ncbi:uncharacterized protein LOC135351603 [Halichondria panicea]|uniref:uncharacterized protein LOC135351603 n=1 Tax=Halichondria panicea TaxID=6063 RepID=UPI00312BAE89